jgi:hypothetical protein
MSLSARGDIQRVPCLSVRAVLTVALCSYRHVIEMQVIGQEVFLHKFRPLSVESKHVRHRPHTKK